MKEFLDENFLLQTKTAEKLYNDFAAGMPIIDYHCHLSPKDIVEDRIFNTITEAWLEGDHYKWRAMRTIGVEERFCSGDASDSEKFKKWAETVPHTLRNPLYHWTHLELKRYFDIDSLLNADTGDSIYKEANSKLSSLSTISVLHKFKVEVVCTTDDPIDSLQYHKKWQEAGKKIIMVPTFRPDKVLFTEDLAEWNSYVDQLSEVSEMQINTYEDLISALQARHDYFHLIGCRLSDNGLDHLYSDDFSVDEIGKIFYQLRTMKMPPSYLVDQFRSAVLHDLAIMNHEKGWAQQYHLGAMRNNNSRMMRKLGKDSGFDSIGDPLQAHRMSSFFDKLDGAGKLAKTIIYNLNPSDNAVFATLAGNFNDGYVAGKMQFGSGWWFLDQKNGIEEQIEVLSNMGLLSRFIGMVTDSRSFLSFPRHEYFRRVLCNVIGNDVEQGLMPNDDVLLKKLIQDICYFNAKNYFEFHSMENKD